MKTTSPLFLALPAVFVALSAQACLPGASLGADKRYKRAGTIYYDAEKGSPIAGMK